MNENMAQNHQTNGQCSKGGGTKNSGRPAKKLYSQSIFRDWCKACGICIAFCPKNVIGKNEAGEPVIERPDDCIGCRFCETHCPDFAITIVERNNIIEARNHA